MRFELWLDESGDFFAEKSKQKKGYRASFIGGILVKESDAGSIDLSVIDPEKTHASELGTEDKQEYLLPILEYLQECGATEVFFENPGYEECINGREQYLQLMAEGLLHLLQWLDAQYESVQLDVLIASKFDNGQQSMVTDQEYRNSLTRCLQTKREKNLLYLHEKSSLQFTLEDARVRPKLQMADFACYVRLTGNQDYFAAYADRIQSLYEDAFLFSYSDRETDHDILKSLADGNIAEAVIDLYTNQKRFSENWKLKYLDLIYKCISRTGYRSVYIQLDQMLSTVKTRLSHEDDYEFGEELCRGMLKKGEFFDQVFSGTEAWQELRFKLNLNLAEMYLKEGDIISARNTLHTCEVISEALCGSVEYYTDYLELQIMMAEYEIVSFQYQKAVQRMEQVIGRIESMLGHFANGITSVSEGSIKRSKYIGEALCTQIRALLSMEKESRVSYDLQTLADKAAFHLETDEIGSERLERYRCLIALENGNCPEAMQWLIFAKENIWVDEVTEDTVKNFLDLLAETEDESTCKEYIQFYLSVIRKAADLDPELCETLLSLLCDQPVLYQIFDINRIRKQTINRIDLSRVKKKTFSILYHPMELIYRNIGKALIDLIGEELYSQAEAYYKEAIRLCYLYREYHAMRITGIGIQAEYASFLLSQMETKKAEMEIAGLKKEFDSLKNINMEPDTREVLEQVRELVEKQLYQEVAELILQNRI